MTFLYVFITCYNIFMQQYFCENKLNIGQIIDLDKEILYHTKKVLRKDDGYIFRMADSTGTIYELELIGDKGKVIKDTKEDNELKTSITVIMSLIKNDKFDLTIQKLTELGVKRIVPYYSNRCVVKPSNDKKIERLKKIVKEAAEQSHRNIIPEITDYTTFKDIDRYKSKYNYIAYEKEEDSSQLSFDDSVTIVIGPEGGFEVEEVNAFKDKGFKSISLGKRILRAETAAIYLTSIIVGNSK